MAIDMAFSRNVGIPGNFQNVDQVEPRNRNLMPYPSPIMVFSGTSCSEPTPSATLSVTIACLFRLSLVSPRPTEPPRSSAPSASSFEPPACGLLILATSFKRGPMNGSTHRSGRIS